MLASNNILSPATGRPIVTPSQDMVLGCYYLTAHNPSPQKGEGKYFVSLDDAIAAYESHQIDIHAYIWVRFNGLIEHDEPEAEPLYIHDTDLLTLDLQGKEPLVAKGDVVAAKAEVAAGIVSPETAQVVQVTESQVLLRPARSEAPNADSLEMTRLYLGAKSKKPMRLVRQDSEGNVISQYIRTTPGRVIYNKTIQNTLVG
jgi:DNA-directed RNA polymerase subunit beta'